MHPVDIPESKRCKAAQRTIERMQHFATLAGWESLSVAIGAAGFTTEQEAL
jgi:phosphoribosylcarboxyaminoimidazole (NCAIR) mutase